MIGKSLKELLFIRLSILLLRAIPLLAIIYTISSLVTRPRHLPPQLEYYLFAECLFHFIYLARRAYLQKPAVHPPLKPRRFRRELFDRCISCMPDTDRFLRLWFRTSIPSHIKRENYIEWLLWAFFANDGTDTLDDAMMDELDEYLKEIERFIGREIEPGKNPAIKPIRLTLDPVVIVPRPLTWYAIVAIVDCITYVSLHYHGFRHFSPSMRLKIFPPRPPTFFSTWSIAPDLPYWYRPHRSSNRLPVVMLHGIGIGLWPYISFLAELKCMDPDVGILVIEMLPISMRITKPTISQERFIEQLTHVLALHHITEFVLIAHSYGSFLAAQILGSSLSRHVSALLLIDPVSLLLHIPDVAYNFVYREPRKANEWQLWYFASRDMGISHTLSRRFFWSDNILWRDDLVGRKVGIILSGEDQIVDTREVWRYITGKRDNSPSGFWKDDKENLAVLWFSSLDHAQVFDTPERRRPLLDMMKEFTTRSYL